MSTKGIRDKGVLVMRGLRRTWPPAPDRRGAARELLLSWAKADKSGQKRARPDTPKGQKRSFRPLPPKAKKPAFEVLTWRKARRSNRLTVVVGVESRSSL